MKKIIDANYFQDAGLKQYLGSSKEHFVVFCDYACMEAYKGNSLKSISKSIEIVSNFPNQVIVLKGTRDLVSLTLMSVNHAQLEDSGQTKGFRDFCFGVHLALSGNESLKAQIIEKGIEASACFDTFRDDAAKVAKGIAELRKSFTLEHLRVLRERDFYPADLLGRFKREILEITALLFSAHPDIDQMPQAEQVRDSYLFRFAVSTYILALRWISDGGPAMVKLDKLRNDIVDMNYVAYATYFDGLLSRDKKMNEIFQETCFVLENMFVVQPNRT
jgi:hypothetical protein